MSFFKGMDKRCAKLRKWVTNANMYEITNLWKRYGSQIIQIYGSVCERGTMHPGLDAGSYK